MQNSDARMVRGLSIGMLILSIVAIVLCLFMIVLFGAAAVTVVNDPAVVEPVSTSIDATIETDPNADVSALLDHYGVTSSEMAIASTSAIAVVLVIYGVWALICNIVMLIASIKGMRNWDKPHKLGGAFGWAIAAIVFSLLCGDLIGMGFFIAIAIYIDRVRKASTAVPSGQPAYAQAPQMPQNPNQQ